MQISIPGFLHIVVILMYFIVFCLFVFCFFLEEFIPEDLISTNNKEIIQIIIQSNTYNRFGVYMAFHIGIT